MIESQGWSLPTAGPTPRLQPAKSLGKVQGVRLDSDGLSGDRPGRGGGDAGRVVRRQRAAESLLTSTLMADAR